MAGLEVKDEEFEFRRKNGEILNGLFSAQNILINKEPFILSSIADITDRKNLEEELKKTSERLTEAQRIGRIGNWEQSLTDGKLIWSDEIYSIFEIDKEKFKGTVEAFFLAIHPEDREAVKIAFDTAVETLEPCEIEHRLLLSDGRVKFVNEKCKHYYDNNGKPFRSVGIVQDITERKQAEAALRESEEDYRNLFENATEAIFVIQDYKVVFQNQRAIMISGYSGEEIVPRQFIEFVHPDERDILADRYIRIMKGEDLSSAYPFRLIQKDGGFLWFEGSSVLIDWKGKPATLSFISDITERKQAEKAMRESEERYRSLFNNSIECVYVHDLEGRFIDANKTALELFGIDKNDITNFNFTKLLDEKQISMAMQSIKEIIETGHNQNMYEFRLKVKDDTYIDMEVSASLIRSEGKPPAIIGMGRDVTERKQTEGKIKKINEGLEQRVEERTKKLKVANKELEVFSQSMIGREQRIIEMKEEINALRLELGREPKYPPIWREGAGS
jgi:PAS domain S-box-containing protein